MNWDVQINKFQPVNIDDLQAPDSGRDLEQMVSLYNRALVHVANDSTDIALISLRKLLSRNPWFSQAAFLAACLLAREGSEQEALIMLQQSIESGTLPEEEAVRANQYLQELVQMQSEDDGTPESTGEKMRSQITKVNSAAILEKIKKRGKVRVASEKERQDVIRQAESGNREETRIENKRLPTYYLRLGIIVFAAILLVVLLLFAGFRWIPNMVRSSAAQRQAAARLEWLLTEIENRSSANPVLEDILLEYEEQFFAPAQTQEPVTEPIETTVADPTPSTTEQPTTTTTLSPSTTPVETIDPTVILLLEAADLYEQAVNNYQDDLMVASEHLLQAREILRDLTPETTSPEIDENAGELSNSVESMISDIARSAAERFRVAGMELFNNREYEEALSFFLTAYALRPDAYGGGVAYYCGRCYQLLDEPELAKPYYEYVIDNFAGRDIASSAASRLREMGY